MVVAIKYSPTVQAATLFPAEGWHLAETLYGPQIAGQTGSLSLELPANDARVFTLVGA